MQLQRCSKGKVVIKNDKYYEDIAQQIQDLFLIFGNDTDIEDIIKILIKAFPGYLK
jgi:hypothetical protein